jgi:hypothetical protein
MLMIALYQPASQENFFWRKPLIGSIFSLICISGLITVFFPERCSEALYLHETERPKDQKDKNPSIRTTPIILKGHHPACGRFSAHTVRIGVHVYCAACAGLLLGAIIAFAGAGLYFFAGLNSEQLGISTVLIGQAGLILGFIQFKFRGYARLISNAFFVFAAFLTLTGIDRLVKNTFIDVYVIFLVIFWLWTRIMISEWDHLRICYACQQNCEDKRKMDALVSSAHPVKSASNYQYSKDYYCEGPDFHIWGDYFCLLQ